MATYLLAWNPLKWPWRTLEQDADSCRRIGFFDDKWSCGHTKNISIGDRVFLMKPGRQSPKGIMASGLATSEPFEGPHWEDPKRTINSVKVKFDFLLNHVEEGLLDIEFLKKELPEVHWTPQAGGTTIQPKAAASLEEFWRKHLDRIKLSPSSIPEIVDTTEQYWEGSIRKVQVNAYERDQRARQASIEHYGTDCLVCGFDFEKKYGSLGRGYIHVHHVVDLSEIGEEYKVDPVKDLVPVRPNCHAMLHKESKPARTVDRLRNIISINSTDSDS